MPNKSLVVGLTGGIASGKTAVSDTFKSLGATIIDTDLIARQVVEPNSLGLSQIISAFGDSILINGHLNRSLLRKIAFNDAKKLEQLNSILHPLIRNETIQQVKNVRKGYCIVVIPLLCESTGYDWIDRILVVDVQPETQLNRLLERDGINLDLAKKMLEKQCNRIQRLAIADDVINNERSLNHLKDNVLILDRLYKNCKN